jgi:type I protein arginine methyltransferase
MQTSSLAVPTHSHNSKKKDFEGKQRIHNTFLRITSQPSLFTMSSPALNTAKSALSSGSSENSDVLDMKDDEGWEDAEPDEEETQFISLLDDEVFTDIHAMLGHCKEKYSFDFLEIRQRLGLDFYGNIKLVNFIRSQVHSGKKVSANISKQDLDDEKYLKPVLEDDALLFSLDELPEVMGGVHGTNGKEVSSGSGELVSRVLELEEELRRIQLQFDNYRATVSETLDDRWNEKTTAGPSQVIETEKEEKRDDDSHYFSSYSYNGSFYSQDFHIVTNPSRYPRNYAEGLRPNRCIPRFHLQSQATVCRQDCP